MDMRALAAEFTGTFAYVAAVAGCMLLVAPTGGGGALTTALSAGLAIVAMTYALGHVSGGHFNPAVTLGLVAAGRFDMADAVGYIVAQVLGGILAALLLSVVLSGALGGKFASFAAISNTFGGSGQFQMSAVMLAEMTAVALLLIVITGATSRKAPAGFAPLAIGLSMAMLVLITLPVSNGSINPARATATAVLAGGRALGDLWVFWISPIIGAVVGGILGNWLQGES